MAKKGIKVKELAKELGVTSRALIERCRAEGMSVQNSITKVPPPAEAAIRGWFTRVADANELDGPRLPVSGGPAEA